MESNLDPMDRTLIIAEAGVNHNGDRALALELVAAAAEAGADLVKFQTFKADDLATSDAEKASYQKEATGPEESQREMLRRLELSHEMHFELVEACKQRNVGFLSAAFDSISLRFLIDELDLQVLKIPSGEITNGPFLLDHALAGRRLILSTGMSTMDEIRSALGVLAFGYLNTQGAESSAKSFGAAFSSSDGQAALGRMLTLLHCTSQYPAPFEDVNLRAMETMGKEFNLPVGYSDHTLGIAVPIAAVARGARVIEKHFTLDRTMDGPDHKASLEPDELKSMIDGIRVVETSLGNAAKAPSPGELEMRNIARKSLVAALEIRKGEVFTVENLVAKRPGTGRSPMDLWSILGRKAQRDYRKEELIDGDG